MRDQATYFMEEAGFSRHEFDELEKSRDSEYAEDLDYSDNPVVTV